MRELDASEQEFIELSLAQRSDVEIHADAEGITVAKKTKVKKSRVPLYRRFMTWMVVLITLPFVLAGIFVAFLVRADSFLGAGTLDLINNQEMTPGFLSVLNSSGLSWLPAVADVYANRGIIIAVIFTVPLLLALLLLIANTLLSNKEAKQAHGSQETS